DLRITGDMLSINGKDVRLNRRGQVAFNLAPAETYYGETYSLKSIMTLVQRGMPLSKINQGDVILILPALYTGNFDVRDTPLGRMPGGFLLAANLNSMLTGDWLR